MKIVIWHLIIAWGLQYGEGQQRIRCKNMKRSLNVLGDKWAIIISTLRRRYERWCKGDDIEDCTHKQQCEESYQSMLKVLQQKTWIDDRKFLKSCVQARVEQGNINHPAYGTWTADFMLRQGAMKTERS